MAARSSERFALSYYSKTNMKKRGSFGDVLQYVIKEDHKSRGLHEVIAAKKIQFNRSDNSAVESVRREITILTNILHPNIVQLIQFDVSYAHAMLFMEYCNMNLKEFTLAYKLYSVAEMRVLSFQLLTGLAYLQSCNILHRDIKDENVLVKFPLAETAALPGVADVLFKWADFGLSKEIFCKSSREESDGTHSAVGNRKFAAPEVLRIKNHWQGGSNIARGKFDGFKADVFSTGSLLYHLLLRRPPYTEAKLMSDESIPDNETLLRPIEDVELRDVLGSMLSWSPSERLSPAELLSKRFYDKMHQQATVANAELSIELENIKGVEAMKATAEGLEKQEPDQDIAVKKQIDAADKEVKNELPSLKTEKTFRDDEHVDVALESTTFKEEEEDVSKGKFQEARNEQDENEIKLMVQEVTAHYYPKEEMNKVKSNRVQNETANLAVKMAKLEFDEEIQGNQSEDFEVDTLKLEKEDIERGKNARLTELNRKDEEEEKRIKTTDEENIVEIWSVERIKEGETKMELEEDEFRLKVLKPINKDKEEVNEMVHKKKEPRLEPLEKAQLIKMKQKDEMKHERKEKSEDEDIGRKTERGEINHQKGEEGKTNPEPTSVVTDKKEMPKVKPSNIKIIEAKLSEGKNILEPNNDVNDSKFPPKPKIEEIVTWPEFNKKASPPEIKVESTETRTEHKKEEGTKLEMKEHESENVQKSNKEVEEELTTETKLKSNDEIDVTGLKSTKKVIKVIRKDEETAQKSIVTQAEEVLLIVNNLDSSFVDFRKTGTAADTFRAQKSSMKVLKPNYEPPILESRKETKSKKQLDIPERTEKVDKQFPEYEEEEVRNKRMLFNVIKELFCKPVKPATKRSPNHTQIVLVGPSGGGKTSTIKHLIGHCSDVAKLLDKLKTSDATSQTRFTCEYIFKLKSKTKLKTSEAHHDITLGIVDTPGLQDVYGPEQDARNLASIKNYLDDNFETSDAFPTLVLFVVRADDTRYEGPYSPFTQCLKRLVCNNLQLTDGTNLIIVLTHACKLAEDPAEFKTESRLKQRRIQQYVHQLTKFKVPVVLLDNKPPKSIKKVGDWTKLHDGTLQPKNLFDAITEILEPKRDVVGKLAVREFFSRDEKHSRVKLVSTPEYPATLTNTTPLTYLEQDFFTALQRYQFPGSVSPATPDFLTDVPLSPFGQEDNLLQTAILSRESTGTGRQLLRDEYIKKYNLLGGYDFKRKIFKNANIFVQHLVSMKDMQVEPEHTIFTQIASTAKATNSNADTFELTICLAKMDLIPFLKNCSFKASLTDGFKGDLLKLSKKYDPDNSETKKRYARFFELYGQGIIKTAKVGGHLSISFMKKPIQNEASFSPETTPTQLKTIVKKLGVKDLPDVKMFYANDLFKPVMDVGNKVDIVFTGGAPDYHDESNLEDWHSSLFELPAIMVEESDVFLYHDYVKTLAWMEKSKRDVIADNLQKAFEDLFTDGRKEVGRKDEKKDVGMMRSMLSKMRRK